MKKIDYVVGNIVCSILLFLFLTSNLFSFSSSGEVNISGQLSWQDTAITGFPEQIKIISQDTDSSILVLADVDSLGRYQTLISPGKYVITLAKNYHWMGEEYIRIDEKATKMTIEVEREKEEAISPLKIYTIPWPGMIPEQGIMHQFNSEKAKLLDEFIETYMHFFEIPGVSLALVKKGEVIYHQSYGVKSLETDLPVDKQTLFEAGSVTKPVFALLVMKLAEKEIIDLDRPLFEYLPFDDIKHDDRYQLITARLVLSHQTGFPNWAKGKFDLRFTPGTKYGYSGEAFEYLKRVIEHISGKKIKELLKAELLDPLALSRLYFDHYDYDLKDAASGHHNNQTQAIRQFKRPMMAYTMKTEAVSFTAFMHALMAERGLKKDTYAELLRPHVTREDGTHWGLGFRLEDTPMGLAYGHSGATSGFICNFTIFKEQEMGYVIFTNSRMGGMLSLPLLTQFLVLGKSENK